MTKQARKFLVAVVKLRKYYEDQTADAMWDCPLCEVADEHCNNCPWVIFTGESCPIKASRLRWRPTPYWRTASIKRLKRWETLIRDGTYDQRVKEQK